MRKLGLWGGECITEDNKHDIINILISELNRYYNPTRNINAYDIYNIEGGRLYGEILVKKIKFLLDE